MGLREMAGDMARTTAGVWRGIADAVDPHPVEPRPVETPPPPPVGHHRDAATGLDEQGGRMIVPLDTWTRILEQVGNVHEAGQQLAEARERAARAETENRFLRDQIKELKAARPARRSARPAARPTPTSTGSAPEARAGSAPPETRTIRVRRRVSTWLSP